MIVKEFDCMGSDENLATILPGNFKIIQSQNGYRYSLDPVLLCHFSRRIESCFCVDFGTGNGVIPLVMAGYYGMPRVVGIELQAQMAERARKNVALNGLEDKIEIAGLDLRDIGERYPAECADLVMSNPPYRSLTSGRVSPDNERAAARHEVAGTVEDFILAARYLLKGGGSFCVIYLAERLTYLLSTMSANGLEPKRIRMVHGRIDSPAKMVMVEGRKVGRPGMVVEPPLVIYSGDDYSDEIRRIYGQSED